MNHENPLVQLQADNPDTVECVEKMKDMGLISQRELFDMAREAVKDYRVKSLKIGSLSCLVAVESEGSSC